MKYFAAILFTFLSISSFAQPFGGTQSQWETYFISKIQSLDPIEGIWSISNVGKLYDKNNTLRAQQPVPGSETVAIYNDGSAYKVYSLDSYDYYGTGTFHNTAVAGIYLFKIFYNTSHSSAKTNAVLTGNGFLEFMYEEPDAETEYGCNQAGEDYISGMKVIYENNWIKIAPQTKDNTKSQPTSGTGFGIASNGIIVTNYHLIDGANLITVRGINSDFNKTYRAKVLVSDKNNDLALIQIDDYDFTLLDTIPYTIKTSLAGVGENIFVLGYPLRATMGDEIKLTNGIVSSRTGFQGDITSYQISAPVQLGSSGGPLFDSQGNLIGIINAKHLGAENASYAVKSIYLTSLLELLSSPPNIQAVNSLVGKSLTSQVERIKKFIYIIEAE